MKYGFYCIGVVIFTGPLPSGGPLLSRFKKILVIIDINIKIFLEFDNETN